MKKVIFLFVTLIVLQKSYSQNSPDAIVGRWRSLENKLEVEIYKDGTSYKAKVVWTDDTDEKSTRPNTQCDWRNPNPALRNRKIIGLIVMTGLTYNQDNHDWENGEIYDAHNGKYWNATASLAKSGLLKVRGYWDFQFIGKDILFKKTFENNYLTTTK